MLHWNLTRSIRGQILLLVLTLVLPFGAMLAWFMSAHFQHISDHAHERVRSIADNTTDNLQRYLRQNEAVLARLAATPLVRAMRPGDCDPILAEFGKMKSEFVNLVVRDRSGSIVCSLRPLPVDLHTASHVPWLRKALAQPRFHASDLLPGRFEFPWVLYLTQPVRDNIGNPVGILILVVDIARLNDELSQSAPAIATITVLDRNGRILLRSKDREKLSGQPGGEKHIRAHHLRDGFVLANGRDRILRLYGVTTMPDTGWKIFAGMPQNVIFEEYQTILWQSILVSTLVVVLSIAVALRLGFSIIRPIRSLANSATLVAAGHNSLRADVDGPGEMRAVAQQFNLMLDARDRQEAALRASEALNTSILDSVSAEIAVLNEQGIIIATNQAWRQFSRSNNPATDSPPSLTGVGSNYLQACLDPESQHVRNGILAVLEGNESGFEMEYPCPAPDQPRWFSMQVTPLGPRRNGAVISHTDITRRKLAEIEQQEAEARTHALISAIPDLIFNNTRSGKYLAYHATAPGLLYAPPADFMNRTIPDIRPPPIASLFMQGIAAALDHNRIEELNYTLLMQGKERHYEARLAPCGSDNVISIVRDVTAHRLAQQALEASVQEKIALLNEVHHRVKNNLQVITSLLRLEAGRSTQGETKVVLTDMKDRIRSMALLHEALYRSGVFAAVDLGAYLNQLATQAFRAQTVQQGAIRLLLTLESVSIGMDQATPCGLLVNELISNCLKHAFADGRNGEVRVQMQTTALPGQLELTVADTGVGLPADFATLSKSSLGLQLVSYLTHQLGGTLEMGQEDGSRSTIHFMLDDARPLRA